MRSITMIKLTVYHIKRSPVRNAVQLFAIRRSSSVKSEGNSDPKFQLVRECFDANLNTFLKGYGGALCIYLDNKCLLDIYGGQHGWKKSTKPWERDTFTSVFSNTKAAGCVSILHQIEKGRIASLDDPLIKYWPEFGQNGKENITVRDVLSHQSGCCIVEIEPDQPPKYKAVINALETMEPNYTPKKGLAYQTFTIGYFVNELTQRASGVTSHEYFEKYIKKPLGIQPNELSFINPVPVSPLYCPLTMEDDHGFFIALNTKQFPVAKAWKPFKNIAKNDQHETEEYYKWDLCNTGFGNARGLATFANKILNNEEHKDVISDEMKKQCLAPVIINEVCRVLDAPYTISLSHFGCDVFNNFLLNGSGAFSIGIGQSFGFLNEEENIAVGYTPSRGHSSSRGHKQWIVHDLFPSIRSALK